MRVFFSYYFFYLIEKRTLITNVRCNYKPHIRCAEKILRLAEPIFEDPGKDHEPLISARYGVN